MPRVNRDLQRRMAARRERERRRPTERRYQFTTPEPTLEPEEELLEEDGAVAEPVQEQAQARPSRAAAAAPVSNRASARSTSSMPFSAYRDEYAYVYSDLRRVAAVIGGLLVALIILYFVLPILAR